MLLVRCVILLLFGFLVSEVRAEPPANEPHPREILVMMGAKMENGASPEALKSYEAIFARLDANSDGWLNRKEFVEDGLYLTEQARRGIFRASDSDQSELVSSSEYVLNRVITDEAKSIFAGLDKDGLGGVSKQEFIDGCSIADKDLAAKVFHRFDSDDSGTLTLPEFLRTWGKWARTSPVSARLIVNQESYILPAAWQSDRFRERVRKEEDCDKLPAAPIVDLVLEIRNTSDAAVMIWPGGSMDEPELTVTGPGIVRPESLRSFSGSSSGTTPQPVIFPGQKYQIPIESLNPGGFSLDSVYWTEPGDYQITATYPVWQNLPPHLPQLFKKQPKPKGLPIRFAVTTPPITVKVTPSDPAAKD